MKTFVLDACALIAYFNDEEGAEIIETLLAGRNQIFVSIQKKFYSYLI